MDATFLLLWRKPKCPLFFCHPHCLCMWKYKDTQYRTKHIKRGDDLNLSVFNTKRTLQFLQTRAVKLLPVILHGTHWEQSHSLGLVPLIWGNPSHRWYDWICLDSLLSSPLSAAPRVLPSFMFLCCLPGVWTAFVYYEPQGPHKHL